MTGARRWRWAEGGVRLADDHFELSFGDLCHTGRQSLVLIALVGKPTNLIFPVQWAMNPDKPTREAQQIRTQVRRQLDFYLVEHPRQFRELMGDPWSYACLLYTSDAADE